ncbi:flagellar protein FlaG (plasmid) [Rossellomorea sp. AcN35-11]|nr:flagellar protein FlaG [Rossellomorea aquimaris]WJV32347.1 flagellar protein FlaG [Rossellomorea sp. AcN35-11]
MEIKRAHRSSSLTNSESDHHERKRYEPQFQYFNNPTKKEPEPPTKEEVIKMLKEINQFLEEQETSIRYEFHEDLREYYVKVVDTNNNEILREIPSKKTLDLYAYIKHKLGLIIDEKA